ncbi:nitroreductase family protein [Myroides marinus]|uniref:nitroreductase family protein n=1 Tax=Myroides marinus TaxID=703342 RepID=UPI0025759497|nr:nitroreductase family protein [Myroides marinus]MDM1405492.1 nitroreductase family protein [Myroides marinus]
MKDKLKDKLRPLYRWFRNRYDLYVNFYLDLVAFKKYATIFKCKDLLQKETDLILNYHGLEKGMLHLDMKPRFAKSRIITLHKILKDQLIVNNADRSQIKVGYQLMCKYYEIHVSQKIPINDYFTTKQYGFYKEVLGENYNVNFEGTYNFSKEAFYGNIEDLNFYDFANSRKSIRNFTGAFVDLGRVKKAVELANTSPSVCNRQATNVYLIEDENKVNELINIQGGFKGFEKDVRQILVVTNNRKFYYTIGERNQFYIDGGIYLMNLLYSLHFNKIACCPANWGKCYKDENRALELLGISRSEKIMCLIVVGEAKESFKTTLSLRRPIKENFKVI